MIDISFDPAIAAALPNFALGVIEAGSVRVTDHDEALWMDIDKHLAAVARTLHVENVPEVPQIAGLRKAYRTLGKDPTRYRGSQEALLRRVLKGKGLYHVNTVVDINNLVSMESFHSLGTFDLAKIDGPVIIRTGRPGETYYGIGRDLLNVEGLPLLTDSQGPFGSPTSDSERTKVTLETISSVTIILSFVGPEGLNDNCKRISDLLGRYAHANAGDIQARIISS